MALEPTFVAEYHGNGAATSTVAVASVDADADDVLLLFVSTRGNIAVSAVDDLGSDAWVLVDAQCGARAQTRIECWRLVATGITAGGGFNVTLASASDGISATAVRYSGARTTTPIPAFGSLNTLGLNGACTGGTDTNDATGAALTTTYLNSRVVAGFNTRTRTMVDTTSWTVRLGDHQGGAGGDLINQSVEDRAISGSVTVGQADNCSGGVADWCLIAVELASVSPDSGGGPTAVPNAMMMMGVG